MDPESFEALGSWLELRAELWLDPGGPVFCTFTGREVQSSYVRHMCRRLRAKLGLSKRVHAHALRHAHAHELFREGVAEKLIPLQLGRASLEATDKYLQRIGAREVVERVGGATLIESEASWRSERVRVSLLNPRKHRPTTVC